jgi:spoIIIJ-associated protein
MDKIDFIKQCSETILDKMLATYSVEVTLEEDIYNIIISTEEEASTIIGRHGETIRAFQKILEVMLYKEFGDAVKVLVDVNDYRAKQKERLEYIGKQHADKVSETSAPAYLRGFSSYERKIIHEYITQNYSELTTYSLGDGKDRRLVVTLKSDADEHQQQESEE